VTTNLELIMDELRRDVLGAASPRGKELEAMAVDAREGAERVRKIVRGLKTFSRADEERRVPLDLVPVLELALNMSFNEIRHRGRLVKDFGPVPIVDGDDSRLAQVFINLFVNAAHSLSCTGVAENEIRVATSTDEEGCAVVEVSDTGAGIPPLVLARVFDPFFTTKAVGVGTGLGLSICHSIVTGMGGAISVRSVVGKGTTFSVVLPPSSIGRLEPIERPLPETHATGGRAKVLIVDDEPMIGNALKRVLGRANDVTTVTAARVALGILCADDTYDVILCDVMMPEMSGVELYEELGKLRPHYTERVVFVTGGAFTPHAHAFLDRVPNERLEKPVDTQRLHALVQRFARSS
jgi:two-component system cell cycle sensor histidine kinase/response regulator CckA